MTKHWRCQFQFFFFVIENSISVSPLATGILSHFYLISHHHEMTNVNRFQSVSHKQEQEPKTDCKFGRSNQYQWRIRFPLSTQQYSINSFIQQLRAKKKLFVSAKALFHWRASSMHKIPRTVCCGSVIIKWKIISLSHRWRLQTKRQNGKLEVQLSVQWQQHRTNNDNHRDSNYNLIAFQCMMMTRNWNWICMEMLVHFIQL